MEPRQDLCANCGRWREEHYNTQGVFVGDRWAEPCVSYQGVAPSEQRAKRKDDELAAVRAGKEPKYPGVK